MTEYTPFRGAYHTACVSVCVCVKESETGEQAGRCDLFPLFLQGHGQPGLY